MSVHLDNDSDVDSDKDRKRKRSRSRRNSRRQSPDYDDRSYRNSPTPRRNQKRRGTYPSLDRMMSPEDDIDRLILNIDKEKKAKTKSPFRKELPDTIPVFRTSMLPDDMETKPLLPEVPFAPTPMRRTCPKCLNSVRTKTTSENSFATYILSFLICAVGGGALCCCFIPLCTDQCKRVQHRCPQCKTYMGEYLLR